MKRRDEMSDTDIVIHRLAELGVAERDALLRRTEDDLAPFMQKVAPVIEDVRMDGDAALRRYAHQFDGAELADKAILASRADFDRAFDVLAPEMIETLEYAADNIRRYHEKQLPEAEWRMEIRPGVEVGERAFGIDSCALYSPRGKGSFPSVTLMTAIPAVVAGVRQPLILTPPMADGDIDPATLVAARLSGVELVAKAGGAQAVAAAAFGTDEVPKCLKIEGPGSPYFVAAKKLLSDHIASRLPAGPSETIIFADSTIRPELAALDILIETEHGDDSSGFLVTSDARLADDIQRHIGQFLAMMSEERQAYARAVLTGTNGGILLCPDDASGYAFINDYAPEHCQILSAEPDRHLEHIRTASEIMLGEYAAGSLANYMMGPNCVLPTSGAAHIHSPLGVHDFMRTASIGRVTAQGFAEMAPKTEIFARYEGFDAHANAVMPHRLDFLSTAKKK